MTILNFLDIFADIFRFFQNFIEFFPKNFGKMLENFIICICRRVGDGAPPRTYRIYKNLCRKVNGNIQFSENFTGNVSIFSNRFKVLANLLRKFWHNFRKMYLHWVRGRSPRSKRISYNFSRKISWNLKAFDNFHILWENFLFKKLILIIIKVSFVGYWKYLLNLLEIKKPSGKFLHVWGKN